MFSSGDDDCNPCPPSGLEKVGYLGSGAASQFQISQQILAGPKAQQPILE